jgi:glycosyltransferase involved in cell wall biosynthesis
MVNELIKRRLKPRDLLLHTDKHERSRVRVLFVIDSLGFGGAERQLVELMKGLIHTDSYEIYIVSLMMRSEGYTDIVNTLGMEIHYCQRTYKYDIFSPLFKIVRCIREYRIELIHTFMNMGSLFGALAAKITGLPVVCSAIRDAKDSSWRDKYIIRFLATLADIYVANSYAGFTNRFRKMRPIFQVVYNGIDFSRFDSDDGNKKASRTELGISSFSRVVGMVASFSKNKDQGTLLTAASKVLNVFPDVGFIFVGDGVTRIELEKRAAELGIGKQAVFTGFRMDVDRIYPLLDICVLLTNSWVHLEGIPNVLVEAMVCGVPVIASCGGGTNEIVDHGKNGIIVPPHDPESTAMAIIRLLSDREEADRLASEAQIRVRNLFGLEKYVCDYENIYQRVLSPLMLRYQ